jgi:DNA-binding NarL/FixJ family response regulator
MTMTEVVGYLATRRLKARYPTTSVIVMTSYSDDALVVSAVQSGASGYLLKDSSRELLSSTVFAVISGGVLIDGSLIRRAYDSLQSRDGRMDDRYPEGGGEIALDDRERRVLLLLSEGHTNRDIAEKMALAEVTIKKMVHRLIKRLGASDRTHAAILALRLGLIK